MANNVPFTFDLDFKTAGGGDTLAPIELQDGDLLIEGWGANYDIDREDEAFAEGAFRNALSKFLSGNAPLCYHHKMDTVIGKVIAAEPVSGKGIKLRAIVDKQNENSPYYHIYDGIKRGRINALSCGGIFKRDRTQNKIVDVDLLEWSATPVSVGRGTNFSVIAGKALDAPFEGKAGDNETDPTTDPRENEIGETPQPGKDPQPAEPAPKEEGDIQRESAEEAAKEKQASFSVNSEGELVISEGAITSSLIAPETITTEHLSPELRSRFAELAPDDPEVDELSEALSKLDTSIEAVAKHIGYTIPQPTEDESGTRVA